MTLATTDTRCVGRRNLRDDSPNCPHRVECHRHIDLVCRDTSTPNLYPVEMWLCRTDQFERRIPLPEGETT